MKKYLYLMLFFLVCVPAIAGTINSYTLKSPPDDADTIVIYDSDDGSTKKIQVGDISGNGSTTGINWSSYPDLTALTSDQEFLINNAGTSSSINWEVVQTQLPSNGWTDGGTNVYPTTTTDTISIGTTMANSATFEILKQGSTSPIKISSSATSAPGNLFIITSGGNVGIGTSNPVAVNQQYLFNMYRDDNRLNLITAINPNTGNIAGAGVELVTADTKANMRSIPTTNTIAGVQGIGRFLINSETGSGLSLAVNDAAQDIRMYVSTSEKFRMTGGGNIGIGTSGPISKLEVNGIITPDKVTSDPCTSGQEGGIFYNDTSNYWCGCNGTDDVKLTDNTTACF